MFGKKPKISLDMIEQIKKVLLPNERIKTKGLKMIEKTKGGDNE